MFLVEKHDLRIDRLTMSTVLCVFSLVPGGLEYLIFTNLFTSTVMRLLLVTMEHSVELVRPF